MLSPCHPEIVTNGIFAGLYPTFFKNLRPLSQLKSLTIGENSSFKVNEIPPMKELEELNYLENIEKQIS